MGIAKERAGRARGKSLRPPDGNKGDARGAKRQLEGEGYRLDSKRNKEQRGHDDITQTVDLAS
jgi:hypothetical protein